MDRAPAAPGAPAFDPALVRRYAEALVGDCLLLEAGDALVVTCEPAHRQLAVAAIGAAARRGARLAQVVYEDPEARRAFLLDAPEERLGTTLPWERQLRLDLIGEDVCLLHLTGPEQPSVLADVPDGRAGVEIARRVVQWPEWPAANQAGRVRFLIAALPTYAWAAQVFPDAAPDAAPHLLLDAILATCRLGPGDPADAIRAHVDLLARRSAALAALDLDALRLRGPGTDLEIGLLPRTRWVHVGTDDPYGKPTIVNWPSEELFTSPDPTRVSGTFRCTRPLSFQGRTIHGLSGAFVDGRLDRLEADDPEGAAVVLGYIDVDDGGRRLGEVALVDCSSRIWQTGRTFADTLFDENAAAHIAFGFGFDFVSDDEAVRARINRSSAHLDVMVGSDEVTITGVGADGRETVLIEEGTWRI